MADVEIDIAGRRYRVACADGQEPALREAGGLIAREAEALRGASGDRFSLLSESRVLLMAGLMLADRFLGETRAPEAAPAPAASDEPVQTGLFEDPAQAARIRELEAELAAARASEAAALQAVEEAGARIRALAAELREDADAA